MVKDSFLVICLKFFTQTFGIFHTKPKLLISWYYLWVQISKAAQLLSVICKFQLPCLDHFFLPSRLKNCAKQLKDIPWLCTKHLSLDSVMKIDRMFFFFFSWGKWSQQSNQSFKPFLKRRRVARNRCGIANYYLYRVLMFPLFRFILSNPGVFSWKFLVGVCRPFSKSWPYFGPKNAIFHTRFQTWRLRNCHHYLDSNSNQKNLFKSISNSRFSLSLLFIWNWNDKYVHTLPWFPRNHDTRLQTEMGKVYNYPFSDQNGAKTIPYPLGWQIPIWPI